MTRLIVVGDHPSLHRGFSVIGDRIARGLQASGRWSVDYVGFYPPHAWRAAPGYRVHDVEPPGSSTDTIVARLHDVLRAVTSDVTRGEPRLLLSIGADHGFLLDALEHAGVRDRVYVIVYMPVDYAPLPPSLAAVLRQTDLIVPYTAFGARALRAVCANDDAPSITPPIPHGVDTDAFAPPTPAARTAARRRVFGVDDEAPLVGYFGRNTGHKHPERALEIFATYARGTFVLCRACGCITPFVRDVVDGSVDVPHVCRGCGSIDVAPGHVNDHARLYMHTELLSKTERALSGGWDLELLAERFGISHQVVFDRSIQIGVGVDEAELVTRMGACDVHLLPYDSGGWELTVLETGACGVANVITDVAAPPEYAAPFSRLVPTVTRSFRADGTRGIIDTGLAVAALRDLIADPAERRRLGQRGVDVARAHTWNHVVRAWLDLLDSRA